MLETFLVYPFLKIKNVTIHAVSLPNAYTKDTESVPVEKHAGTAEETNMATNIETNIMAIDLALDQQSVVSRT